MMPATTDTLGKVTSFAYLDPQATSATQRPVPYHLLGTITTPEQPALPHTAYDYDSEGRVKQVKDAEALQRFDRDPYRFFLADGTRGARQDPMGGLYSVVYDTYGHGSRFIDELGRETDAVIDSRERPITYTYPEGDCEAFAYDDHNNTIDYIKVDKTFACNYSAGTNHRLLTRAAYDQTWNKITALTTPNGNQTTFSYYPAGVSGASLMATATRPAVPVRGSAGNISPAYNFTYDPMGKVSTATVPLTATQLITTTNTYDTNENLTLSQLDATGIDAQTHYGYDTAGNVTSTTDPRGAVTEDIYDSERRKTESHHHDGAITAALNAASRITYDELGRDVKDEAGVTFSGTSVSTWQVDKTTTYTPTSKVASVTDADGGLTLTTYDGLDRIDTVTDPVGRRDHFAYDAAGNTLVEYRAWQTPLQQAYSTSTYGGESAYRYQIFQRLLFHAI